MKYDVGGVKLSYEVEGECFFGDERVLLDDAIDLTSNTPWSSKGYTIEKLFSEADFSRFHQETEQLIRRCWIKAGLENAQGIELTRYHTCISDYSMHRKCVDQTKLLPIEDFPGGVGIIEDRISQMCGLPLQARNPFDDQSVFHFRVIRPSSTDNNPLHRDVWLEDYADCINLYIPVAGSNELSSLIIAPGSHRWPENKVERTRKGAKINGIQFNVPAVSSIRGDYEITRPNPSLNEVLLFSPYLIHGGAVNLNKDVTRISIELRLWIRKYISMIS